MNLTTLKASAEQAKASKAELEIWQMEISPDDVLRLVEVVRYAMEYQQIATSYAPLSPAIFWANERLHEVLEGFES